MNKYKIKISHVFSEVFDIEAANEDEAKEKAKVELQREDRSSEPQYEATFPIEHWPVITEERYNEMIEKYKEELAKEKDENKESKTNLKLVGEGEGVIL